MTDNGFDLTRRKTLAALGTIGAASAGAGLGTSAFFSDQETFENNRLTAGTLDMKVSWEEHYVDWRGAEAEIDGVQMVDDTDDLDTDDDGEDELVGLPSHDGPRVGVPKLAIDEFMDATLQERFPDKQTRQELEQLPPGQDPCAEGVLADVPEDLDEGGQPRPLIDLQDVKPGDFGEVTFDFVLCTNPGWVWLTGALREAAENGRTEPETDDPDETDATVELLDEIQVTIWYDSGDNILSETETYVTQRSVVDGNPLSSAVALTGDQRIVARGSLRSVLNQLGDGAGLPIDGLPQTDARDCFAPTPTIHRIGVLWELPADHGNEVQSDSVRFDLGFYTEQCRHNDGSGMPPEIAEVTVDDQESDGTSVTVDSVGMPRDGYVAIHDDRLLQDPPQPLESVIGVSEYLEAGFHSDLTVDLFTGVPGGDFQQSSLSDGDLVIGMPHEETDGDQTYDFVATGASDDPPFVDENGDPVVDPATVTVTDS